MAISWLEATFPELANQEAEGGDLSMLRAHPYALFDASISLQVPIFSCQCSMMLQNLLITYAKQGMG